MQISRSEVFIFVEGKRADPFFYGEVCSTVSRRTPFRYHISLAQDLPGGSGGKQVLIDFFTYLRRKSALKMSWNGMSKAALFYVDKDVDDLLRIRRRSDHFIYSEFYDVHNHIFRNGDLVRGSAAAASADASLLSSCLVDVDMWCKNAANRWREWVKVCLFCKKHEVRGESNYSVISRINKPSGGDVDQQEYSRLLARLRRASGLPISKFKKDYTSVSQTVDRLYARGEHDRVFKGAWYAQLLHHDVARLLVSQAYDSSGFLKRVPCAIAATLDFRESWADHFRKPLERIVAEL
jgi:hypothetical protein